jgi:hypothetical protein
MIPAARAWLRALLPFGCALVALVVASCATTRPHATGPAPIVLRPGVRLLTGSQGDAAPTGASPGALLVCHTIDVDGDPLPLMWFQLPELHHAALTDADGLARMPRVVAGDWLVTWRVPGVAHDDSVRVHLEVGSADTLEVRMTAPR